VVHVAEYGMVVIPLSLATEVAPVLVFCDACEEVSVPASECVVEDIPESLADAEALSMV
jgi:hypothetical protein